jgi:hypothetical protein
MPSAVGGLLRRRRCRAEGTPRSPAQPRRLSRPPGEGRRALVQRARNQARRTRRLARHHLPATAAARVLHETPASVSRIARLSSADFAEDTKGKTYAILGKNAARCAPWPISGQARDAVDTLRGEEDDARLISPQTKNPNVHMVRAAVEQTRADADVQTPNLIAAPEERASAPKARALRAAADRAGQSPALPARSLEGHGAAGDVATGSS